MKGRPGLDADGDAGAGEQVRATFSELRRYANGDLAEADHHDVHPSAGLVHDEDVTDVLAFASEAYDRREAADDRGLPVSFWRTDFAQSIVRREATHTANEAVQRGNISQGEFITGWTEYENDVSGLRTIQKLENWMLWKDQCKVIYMASNMGSGKTDFALLLLEIAQHATRHAEGERTAELATNIPSAAERNADIGLIEDYDRLKQWATIGSHQQNKWFVFDEASSELSGYSTDRQQVEEYISGLMKKMRKNGCNLVVIGHSGKDVHPDIRRLSDFVEKRSLKTASIYAGVENQRGVGRILKVDRVPATGFDFDTEDEAEWSWGTAADEDDMAALDSDDLEERMRDARNAYLRAIYENTDMSQQDVADAVGLSKGVVNNAVNTDSDVPV